MKIKSTLRIELLLIKNYVHLNYTETNTHEHNLCISLLRNSVITVNVISLETGFKSFTLTMKASQI